jgi:MFS family permease
LNIWENGRGVGSEREGSGPLAEARPQGTPTGLRQAFSALRYRDFRRFWTGAALSNAGTWMQNVTVPYVILLITRSATWVGVAAFCQLFPSVILGPVAGSLADRFDRRKLLLFGQVAQALLALSLWWAWVSHHRDPRLLVVLLTGNGAAFGVVMPAWQAFVTELVPRRALLNAITLNSAQFNGARAIGPAIGGLILGRFGPSWAFLANAVSFLAVIAALLTVRPQTARRVRSRRRILGEFAEGLAYVRRHPGLLLAVTMVGVVFFLGNPVFQLVPVFAQRVFRVGPTRYGLLGAAYGIGAVLGAVVLGFLGDRFRRSSFVVAGTLLYGISLVGLGLVPRYRAGFTFLVLGGIAFLAVIAVLNTSVQLLVTEEIRGRVLAIYMMVLTGSLPLGALLQGWLADRIGAPATVILAGGLLCLAGLVLALRPSLARSLDDHRHQAGLEPGPALEAEPAASAI